MASSKQRSRCCNPFDLKPHFKRFGLRPATEIMRTTLGLGDYYLLCTSCRKEATNIVKKLTTTSDDPNVDESDHEDNSSDSNENNSETDNDSHMTATDLPL